MNTYPSNFTICYDFTNFILHLKHANIHNFANKKCIYSKSRDSLVKFLETGSFVYFQN